MDVLNITEKTVPISVSINPINKLYIYILYNLFVIKNALAAGPINSDNTRILPTESKALTIVIQVNVIIR